MTILIKKTIQPILASTGQVWINRHSKTAAVVVSVSESTRTDSDSGVIYTYGRLGDKKYYTRLIETLFYSHFIFSHTEQDYGKG